jgi:hypothetical protein
MASPTVDIATGFTIAFPNSSFSAEVIGVQPPGTTCEDHNVSHMGTTNEHSFKPSDLNDPGEMTINIHMNPDTAIPVGTEETAILLTWPSTATWTFAGYIKSYTPDDMPLDEKMTGTLVVKVSDAIAISAGTGG